MCSSDLRGERDRNDGMREMRSEGNNKDWRRRQDGRRGGEEKTEVEVFGEVVSRSTAGIDFDKYDAIPVQITGANVDSIKPISRFSEAKLTDSLFDNIRRCGYDRPTPVQKHSIPIVVSGRDLMACAQTGSGKTCAFMIPCLESLLRSGPPPNPSGSRRPKPMPCGLVLAPTRELAAQIHVESTKFSFETGIRCCIIYGGADMREQRMDLEKGCDILIATPGRLSDMAERSNVSLELIQFFILDEADRMLDMGFEPQIRKIINMLPQERQTVMFTATWPTAVRRLASDFLRDFVEVRVGEAENLRVNPDIEQRVVLCDDMYGKEQQLVALLQENSNDQTIVFVNTKRECETVALRVDNSVVIHGDKDQHERDMALSLFKSGSRRVLVATDVAARGLEIGRAHV